MIRSKVKVLLDSISLLLLSLSTAPNLFASGGGAAGAPPINLETLFSDKGSLIGLNFSRAIAPGSRFGIFSIAEHYGTHKIEEQLLGNSYMAQTHLTYQLFKNFNITAGGMITQATGFRPIAGLQYNLKLSDFFILLSPRIDLNQSYSGEILGFVEYTPQFNGGWGLYSRFQGMYTHNLKNDYHDISYLRGRIGASYKNFRFGLGLNFTYYGPTKVRQDDIGLFLGLLLF